MSPAGLRPSRRDLAHDVGVALHVAGRAGPPALHRVGGEDRDPGAEVRGGDLGRGGPSGGRRFRDGGRRAAARRGERENQGREKPGAAHERPPEGRREGENSPPTTRAGAESFQEPLRRARDLRVIRRPGAPDQQHRFRTKARSRACRRVESPARSPVRPHPEAHIPSPAHAAVVAPSRTSLERLVVKHPAEQQRT